MAGAVACERAPPSPPTTTAAPSATSVATATPEVVVHRLAEPARARDYILTVKSAAPCKVERFFQPRAGHVLFGVAIEVEATAREVVVNGFHARLVAADGSIYPATLGGCEPLLKTRALAPGDKGAGLISFEIPEKASDLVLIYDPRIAGAPRQELRVRLGR